MPIRLFPNPGMDAMRQPILAYRKVRYVGEPIAFVVADSPEIVDSQLSVGGSTVLTIVLGLVYNHFCTKKENELNKDEEAAQ